MIFPLKAKKIIRTAQEHVNVGLGVGVDYVANFETVSAPFTGNLEFFQGPQGGNWARLVRDNGDKMEFAHLSQYLRQLGPVLEGEEIAISGNSGSLTTNPHLHIQIIDKDGNRIDPEKYFFEFNLPLVAINGTIPYMKEVQFNLLQYSAGSLTCTWDLPTLPLGDPTQDEVYALLDTWIPAHPEYAPNRWFVLFQSLPNAFAKTYYYPKYNCCVSVIPTGFPAKLVVFELSHAFQMFYNENRGGFPHVEVVDSNFPEDSLIRSKLRSVVPYIGILNK